MNSISQMIDNSQNSLSLIQIKNDLDQLNNKMNAISQNLYNINKINNYLSYKNEALLSSFTYYFHFHIKPPNDR